MPHGLNAPRSSRNRSRNAVIRPSRVAPSSRVVQLLARVSRALKVLSTRLDPLHGPAEARRDHGDEDVLVVDGSLRPEASADLGGDDAQLVRREVQHLAERALEPVRHLGRGPDREAAAVRGRLRQDPPGLDRHPGVARHADAGAHAHRRFREGALGLADSNLEGDAHVVAPLLVEDGGARREPGLHVDDGREGLVVDLDEIQGVLRRVRIGGDDHGHRLADVADPVVGQRELRGGLQAEPHASLERRGRRAGNRERPEQRLEVGVREAADDRGVAARAVQPDRGIRA